MISINFKKKKPSNPRTPDSHLVTGYNTTFLNMLKYTTWVLDQIWMEEMPYFTNLLLQSTNSQLFY